MLAGDLSPDDILVRLDVIQNTPSFEKIVSIHKILESGYICPLTKSGNLIVNGCIVSCFANTFQNIA